MRVGIVVPHIFMHRDILPHVIFSPGALALTLVEQLSKAKDIEVVLFSPGAVDVSVRNVTADLSLFEQELAGRGDTYLDLLKKHPFTFVTLARQVQSELIAQAYDMANRDELDIVHIYTNEEDIALPFAKTCTKPVAFTHHDPFNFLVKYKNVFPKYKHLPWISISYAQRQGMPSDTNWLANIYHGVDGSVFYPKPASGQSVDTDEKPKKKYVACIGRIIEAKGTHLAIAAVQSYNRTHPGEPLQLRLAGKHYAGNKDAYWKTHIEPQIDGETIIYDGFVDNDTAKRELLADAEAVIVPSVFQEPFGMVIIESLACGTPVVGLNSGAISEVIQHEKTGFVIEKDIDESKTVERLAKALVNVGAINRGNCRQDFEDRFTVEAMAKNHATAYAEALTKHRANH
jgi:glycosyltransferase involved in cell wall biosynthesis